MSFIQCQQENITGWYHNANKHKGSKGSIRNLMLLFCQETGTERYQTSTVAQCPSWNKERVPTKLGETKKEDLRQLKINTMVL